MPNTKTLVLSFIICALTLFCNLCFGICHSYAQDKIIAIVNQDVITQKDLNDFVTFMRMQLSREYEGKQLEEKMQNLKQDLLNKLIEDRLILQEAKKILEEAKKKSDPYTVMRLDIPANRIKAKIEEIRKRYPSDLEFQADLTRQGLSQADLENKFKEQSLMYNIVELKVRERIIVRPEEVTNFYNQNQKEFVSPQEREINAITVEKKDVADAVSYGLRTGKSLADLAAIYPLTVNNISAKEKGELRKEIEEVVFNLGIKEVSIPVKIDEQYYVFILNNIIPSRKLSLKEAQENVQEYLFNKKMQEELTRWLDELKKQSFIKITQN